MTNPKNFEQFYFPGKEPDEQIRLVLRRHSVAIGKKLITFVMGAVLPIGVIWLIYNYTSWLKDSGSFIYVILVLFASLLYLYLLLFSYHAWVDYYLDIWIVTDERIIAMEQKGLFNRTVAELRLDKIQDVSSEIKGFLPTIFKYGTVQVQTASGEDNFVFDEAKAPELAARQILELHEAYLNKNQGALAPEHQDVTSKADSAQ